MGSYYKIQWKHRNPNLPTHIVLAVDMDGNPTRRLDVYSDRHWEWTNDPESLPEALTPDRERGDDFLTESISSAAFIDLWRERHTRSLASPAPLEEDALDEVVAAGKCQTPGCHYSCHQDRGKFLPVCRSCWTLVTLRCYQRSRYPTYRHAYNEAKQLSARESHGQHSSRHRPMWAARLCDMCRHWHVSRPGPRDEEAARAAQTWRNNITTTQFSRLMTQWNPEHDPRYNEIYSHPRGSVWRDGDGTLYELVDAARSERLHLREIEGQRRTTYPRVKDFFNTFTPIDEGRVRV